MGGVQGSALCTRRLYELFYVRVKTVSSTLSQYCGEEVYKFEICISVLTTHFPRYNLFSITASVLFLQPIAYCRLNECKRDVGGLRLLREGVI